MSGETKGHDFLIVGAGVIGLSVCQQLLIEIGTTINNHRGKNDKGKDTIPKIKIVAKHFPEKLNANYSCEYTSPWAGAHFRPFPHRWDVNDETYSSDKRESGYTRTTMKYFKERERYNLLNGSSVQLMRGQDVLESPSAEYKLLADGYNGKSLTGFVVLSQGNQDGDTSNLNFKAEYDTYCLNAPEYLLFLYCEIEKLALKYGIKVEFVRKSVSSLRELVLSERNNYQNKNILKRTLVFNCSGLGLQWRDNGYDPKCYKIRGQTLLIDVPDHYKTVECPYDRKTITYQAEQGKAWTFVIKRPCANDPAGSMNRQFIIGGTKQPYDCQTIPRHSDTQELIARARKYFPDLINRDTDSFKIARVNVGFRPARIGGSKVNLEYHAMHAAAQLDQSTKEKQIERHIGVINCYGFGGMGFECSIGAAQHCVELYRQYTREAKL